jgi:hypothetical protein
VGLYSRERCGGVKDNITETGGVKTRARQGKMRDVAATEKTREAEERKGEALTRAMV